MQRQLRFSTVFNFRDLGGYPAMDGRPVRWRRLFRSDSLAGLTDEDRAVWDQLAIRTVIDLRRPYELAAQGRVPAWDGLAYHHIPPEHREWDRQPYEDGTDVARYLADRYRDLAEEGAAGLAAAISVIAEEQAAPAVVHCVAGKDRTGVLVALTLALLGVADVDIDADYVLSTAGNRAFVAWAQANGAQDVVMRPWYYSVPGTMILFLSELRHRHGSVERYLRGAGLERDRIAALRAHLLR